MTSWHDDRSQSLVIEKANDLIEDVVLAIYKTKLPVYKAFNCDELTSLICAPIYLAVNIFIERLLRVIYQIKTQSDVTYPQARGQWRYFKNTREAILNYYHDFFINYSLMNNFQLIINPAASQGACGVEFPRPQDDLLAERPITIKVVAALIITYLNNAYVNVTKPKIIAEYSHWMNEIFSFRNLLRFDFEGKKVSEDSVSRNQIRKCCQEAFFRWNNDIIGDLSSEQKEKLAKIFADFIDHVLPLSLVEGIEGRSQFYECRLKGWKIEQVHSFTGYIWNDSFKVFAALAKRQGAVLICHVHGGVDVRVQSRRNYTEFPFLDYYFTWANTDCAWMKGEEKPFNNKLDNLRIIGLGSAYLNSIKKITVRQIDPKNITILYPSSPLWNFTPYLDEISQEKKCQHRFNVLGFLKEILKLYPNTKILYKPLWTYATDPIKEYFVEERRHGAVELTNKAPKDLFGEVDVVLWDTISTGFTEAIQSGVPTLVFQSREEYEHVLPFAKTTYQALLNCGVVFHDVKSGVYSLKNIVFDLAGFLQAREQPIRRLQKAIAYPVAKKEFLHKMELALRARK